MLTEDLQRDGALTRDHVGVVERMDEGQGVFTFETERVEVGVRIAVAVQHDVAAVGPDSIDLESRGGHGHDDHRLAPEPLGCERHALGMISRRSTDDAASKLFCRQMRHLVIGASQLEAEYRLAVFALQEHLVRKTFGEASRGLQRRFDGDVVDACSQNLLKIRGERQRRRHLCVLALLCALLCTQLCTRLRAFRSALPAGHLCLLGRHRGERGIIRERGFLAATGGTPRKKPEVLRPRAESTNGRRWRRQSAGKRFCQ